MATDKIPKERWNDLKAHIIAEIEKIDGDTPWQVTEPKWWLEMSEIERTLINSKIE